MLSEPVTTNLPDGTRILVRMVNSTDNDLIKIGFDQLSERSRYLRFLHPVARLSEQQLDAITKVRDHDHVACGAFDLSAAEPEPIGLARYVRIPDQSDEAEFAVAVIDSHQGRGLGSLLLGMIACLAVVVDVQTFIGVVHDSNAQMKGLLRQLNPSLQLLEPGVSEYRVPLHTDPNRYPISSAGRSFRLACQLAKPKNADSASPVISGKGV